SSMRASGNAASSRAFRSSGSITVVPLLCARVPPCQSKRPGSGEARLRDPGGAGALHRLDESSDKPLVEVQGRRSDRAEAQASSLNGRFDVEVVEGFDMV